MIIYARSSTYLFTQFHRSRPGAYSRNNRKGVEGQESYIRKPKSPIIFIIYYKFQFLRVHAPFSRREISVCSCQHSLSRKMGIFPVVRKYSLWVMISLFTSKMYGLVSLRSTLENFLVHNFWRY